MTIGRAGRYSYCPGRTNRFCLNYLFSLSSAIRRQAVPKTKNCNRHQICIPPGISLRVEPYQRQSAERPFGSSQFGQLAAPTCTCRKSLTLRRNKIDVRRFEVRVRSDVLPQWSTVDGHKHIDVNTAAKVRTGRRDKIDHAARQSEGSKFEPLSIQMQIPLSDTLPIIAYYQVTSASKATTGLITSQQSMNSKAAECASFPTDRIGRGRRDIRRRRNHRFNEPAFPLRLRPLAIFPIQESRRRPGAGLIRHPPTTDTF